MSLINGIIPPRSYEVIRDQIGAILAVELQKQYELSGNKAQLKVKVWVERFIPFHHEELPAVNVIIARGTFGGQTAIQADGTYAFNIDVHTKSKSEQGNNGDGLAMKWLHKILGMAHAILNDPKYEVLGFDRPFIMSSKSAELTIADPNEKDTESVVMGRLIHNVKAPETYDLISPPLLKGNDTVVKLEETEFGHTFIFTSPV